MPRKVRVASGKVKRTGGLSKGIALSKRLGVKRRAKRVGGLSRGIALSRRLGTARAGGVSRIKPAPPVSKIRRVKKGVKSRG